MKGLLSHIAAMYMGAGLFGGLVMQAAVPAMNGLGVTYYAATWPAFLYCVRSDVGGCDPFAHVPMSVASLMFDLDPQ